MLSKQELIRILMKISIPDIHSDHDDDLNYPGSKPAAVLIPILNASGLDSSPEWHLLFTKRTELVADHKGQVSFPGGRSDPNDLTPENTALREAYEEIGLLPEDVQVIGKLEPLVTITNYLVTPVLGLIPWPYSFTPQPDEVSSLFTIPVNWLADPANREIRRRPDSKDIQPHHLRDVIYFKPYQGETLWGVSAEITVKFLEKLSKYFR